MSEATKQDTPGSQFGRFGSGKPVRRVEDADLLAGRGRFADDVSVADQVFACFLRSPHPHARIESIDVKAAAAMPGGDWRRHGRGPRA
jgi:carbon-monoxide dehydrogenase large subunit